MSRPRTPSARAAARALARRDERFVRDAERLARLQPGGTPEHPIDVPSASIVEVRARSTPCPICNGALRLDEHVVVSAGAARLREARMTCTNCGAQRAFYFRVGSALPN